LKKLLKESQDLNQKMKNDLSSIINEKDQTILEKDKRILELENELSQRNSVTAGPPVPPSSDH
jgi:hypothetical protein